MDFKWYCIMCAVLFGAMYGGMAISDYSKNHAKQEAIVACYHAGNKDCDKIWSDK